ncbi:hypothetical protein SAMN04488074_102152 [Lentzea albidocapillata subsp. violacea]|uniref:Uncharacterized protein n=1 Tax=Lentzea albidocapillata subsp. violacea TaxID=128104 RepID=A0A1G8U343_9PSEU|nr:hypothetical protein SAMN04488074_102152 [Lentzea albidocapillata subsp. violacea]
MLAGFVLLVGNPWVNTELAVALSSSGSAARVVDVVLSYPSWHVDVDRAGPFLFWFANLRTVLFVLLAVAGLSRVSRWVSETAGLFVATVGLTALSAVVAGLASGVVMVALLDPGASLPYLIPGQFEDFFLSRLSSSAMFGVLFGSVLGAVVALQRRGPVNRERRAEAPKSLW